MKYIKKDWEPWVKLVSTEWFEEYEFEDIKPNYKTLVGLACSVAKWDHRFPGKFSRCFPCNCGMCKAFDDCLDCLLFKHDESCGNPDSVYAGYSRALSNYIPTEPWRKKMHDLLLNLYEQEYKRVIG